MRRVLFAPGVLRHLNLIALAALVAVGAFQAGRAGATGGSEQRRRTAVVRAVEYAAPAVVSISATKSRRRNVIVTSAGSGVLVHPAGFVITNSHVIRGCSAVFVELWRERARYRAQVVADLPGGDLALLRIHSQAALPYVSIADSRGIMLGETVIAIGNPHGLGDTITTGVVSAIGRSERLSSGARLRDLIQTDAPINSGNSGGALLNLDGELLGVVVSLMPRATGIAFAIPGNQVRALLDRALGGTPASKPLPEPPPTPARPPVCVSSIREAVPPERASREVPSPAPGPRLPPPRVASSEASPGLGSASLRATDFGLTVRQTGGAVRITGVRRPSVAYLAGLHTGDLVVSIGGRSITSASAFASALGRARSGEYHKVRVLRSGREIEALLLTPTGASMGR